MQATDPNPSAENTETGGSDARPAPPQLSAIEARIVASLLEKEATTPDAYPLTLNAIVVACNQKTAREPTMDLEPGTVAHALRQLEPRGWVKSQHAARAERYTHRIELMLDIPRAQAVLLALLMLRGPQTVSELLIRSERLSKFSSTADVLHALERLAQRGLTRQLPRASGQREDRHAHLLSGEPVIPAQVAGASPSSGGGNTALVERVAELEAHVAALETRLAALEQALL